ncbi:EFR1 family ferrodoxin [Clostridium sp. YIM B02555]|uniref:EFR1 family ferrodoxin n=1 Tax=Clostridium sp. YIM B02555 TaxID=2911968 RepID=UPI001EEF1DAB|nr:EFR1 family ferrodoxin [Clostridium sp. YIM B02555]
MIFYFSGTGNSLQIAKNIAEYNGEQLISIAAEMKKEKKVFDYNLKENEVIGFVYPTYAWAPPEIVLEFISKINFNNYKKNYVFSVATCATSVGNLMKVLSSSLEKKNIMLDSGFSLIMPTNYITSKNIDPKEIVDKKLLEAEDSLKYINKVIKDRKKNGFQIEKGTMPLFLSSIINLLFNKAGRSTKKFYANDNCIGCGICESVCSYNTIKVEGKPKWGKDCAQCLGCINLCPVKAIQYGKGTEGKERYKNPNITIDEMKINI